MKKIVGSFLGMIFVLGAASVSQARAGGGSGSGVLFDLNLFYYSYQDEYSKQGGSSTQSGNTDSIYDIKLGKLENSGLYWGGIYTSRSNSVLNQAGTSGSAYGASIGYVGGSGFYVLGHYLISATYGTESSGSGIQADLGYMSVQDNNFVLGAVFTYRSMTYTKNSNDATMSSDKITEEMPMLTLGYMF